MGTLRVCIVIGTFLPITGGAERMALSEASTLTTKGSLVTVITIRHHQTWPAREIIDGFLILRVGGGVASHRQGLPAPLRKLAYLTSLLVLGWALWRHRHSYDVVHLYQLKELALPASLACLLARKPFIVSVCSPGPDRPRAEGAKLLSGPLDPQAAWLKIGERAFHGGDLSTWNSLGKPGLALIRFLLHRTNATLVVPSARMRGYLAGYGLSDVHVQVIPNAVDTTRFVPANIGVSSGHRGKVVVCVARLSYEKGPDVLLQAWRLIHEQERLARLVMVGDGPVRVQVEQLARELGVAECVEFAGAQMSVLDQLQRADVAVLPSRWESFSLALLEAMACGMPCVATRVCGSEDIVQHGVNGLLVESEDYEALARAVLTLLHDAARMAQYGREARATAEQYSVDHIFEAYLQVFQRQANCASRSPDSRAQDSALARR